METNLRTRKPHRLGSPHEQHPIPGRASTRPANGFRGPADFQSEVQVYRILVSVTLPSMMAAHTVPKISIEVMLPST